MQVPLLLCPSIRPKSQLLRRYCSFAFRFLQGFGCCTIGCGRRFGTVAEVPEDRKESNCRTGTYTQMLEFLVSLIGAFLCLQRKNDTYEFLSGVAITPRTQFLSLHENADLELFQTVIHYANYAVRVYGWPIYVMTSKMGLCRICPNLSCCACSNCRKDSDSGEVVDDNCCRCNYAVLQKLNEIGDIEIVYATYHVDVGETPFFVALDYDRKKVVVSIRGTLSMQVSVFCTPLIQGRMGVGEK